MGSRELTGNKGKGMTAKTVVLGYIFYFYIFSSLWNFEELRQNAVSQIFLHIVSKISSFMTKSMMNYSLILNSQIWANL
jgi:hypothetical protein